MGIITGAVKKSKQKSKRFHCNFLISFEKEEQKCWLYDETPFCQSIT